MNILLTCVGRRSYFVRYFREALNHRGEVFVADISPNAEAMREADRGFIVPPVVHPDYFDVLRDICHRHEIRLLISVSDIELPLLARERESFLAIGTIPVVSASQVIETCFDKYRAFKFLKSHDIVTPNTYSELGDARSALDGSDITFPAVVKPRWGAASIGIFYPENREELELLYSLAKKCIMRSMFAAASLGDPERSILIQEYLDGEEINLDIVNDLDGNYVSTLVTHKLALRSGETDRAVTTESDEMQALGALIGTKLGHIGILDCDVIVSNGDAYVLELNPRFGGAYPFSHVAGANIPAALIAWANGEEPDPSWLRVRPNVMASKSDRLVVREQSCISSESREESMSGWIEYKANEASQTAKLITEDSEAE